MKIGKKGQVTIPKDIRDLMRFLPGTELEFIAHGMDLILRKNVRKSRRGEAHYNLNSAVQH